MSLGIVVVFMILGLDYFLLLLPWAARYRSLVHFIKCLCIPHLCIRAPQMRHSTTPMPPHCNRCAISSLVPKRPPQLWHLTDCVRSSSSLCLLPAGSFSHCRSSALTAFYDFYVCPPNFCIMSLKLQPCSRTTLATASSSSRVHNLLLAWSSAPLFSNISLILARSISFVYFLAFFTIS